MAATTTTVVCPHCESENTPTREVCFRCREPLHLEGGFAAPLPSVVNEPVLSQSWALRVWHEVTAPGAVLDSDGGPGIDMIVREVGTESLVFDSDNAYRPGETIVLEFELERRRLRLDATVQRTARTLAIEMCFATTVELKNPGEDVLTTVTQMNPVDEKAWWD